MHFLCEYELIFGKENICIYTTLNERRFRNIAEKLVLDGYAPSWFSTIKYIEWVGAHKDLRFVDDDIRNVIIVDDNPPYIKYSQKHRLRQIKQFMGPYTHAVPDMAGKEIETLLNQIKSFLNNHLICCDSN
jgi:hypothetical protein